MVLVGQVVVQVAVQVSHVVMVTGKVVVNRGLVMLEGDQTVMEVGHAAVVGKDQGQMEVNQVVLVHIDQDEVVAGKRKVVVGTGPVVVVVEERLHRQYLRPKII